MKGLYLFALFFPQMYFVINFLESQLTYFLSRWYLNYFACFIFFETKSWCILRLNLKSQFSCLSLIHKGSYYLVDSQPNYLLTSCMALFIALSPHVWGVYDRGWYQVFSFFAFILVSFVAVIRYSDQKQLRGLFIQLQVARHHWGKLLGQELMQKLETETLEECCLLVHTQTRLGFLCNPRPPALRMVLPSGLSTPISISNQDSPL